MTPKQLELLENCCNHCNLKPSTYHDVNEFYNDNKPLLEDWEHGYLGILQPLMDEYVKFPGNRNKTIHSMYALIEDLRLAQEAKTKAECAEIVKAERVICGHCFSKHTFDLIEQKILDLNN